MSDQRIGTCTVCLTADTLPYAPPEAPCRVPPAGERGAAGASLSRG